MNRYVAEGVVRDMLVGKRVLVLCELRSSIRAGMQNVLRAAADSGFDLNDFQVRWANGHESITDRASDGGQINFTSVRSSLRGLAPDVIFVDGDDCNLGNLWWDELNQMAGRRAEVLRR